MYLIPIHFNFQKIILEAMDDDDMFNGSGNQSPR